MPVRLLVAGLDGPLCEVQGELTWTGRQLKLAIQDATAASILVSEQRLSIGKFPLNDSDALCDIAEGAEEQGPGRPMVVQLVRATDFRILRECSDRHTLATALVEFEGAPVCMLFEHPGNILLDAKCNDEPDGHSWGLPIRNILQDVLPWQIFGIEAGEIAAVLCLAAFFELDGDGVDSIVAVVLMTSGELVALTARIFEALRVIDYTPLTLTAALRIESLAELREQAPFFVEAMFGLDVHAEVAPIGPLQLSLAAVDLPYAFCNSLRSRFQGPSQTEDVLQRPGLLLVSDSLRLPKDLGEELKRANDRLEPFARALHTLGLERPGNGDKGGGKGAHDPRCWGELVEQLAAAAPEDEYVGVCLARIAAAAVPEHVPQLGEFLDCVSAEFHFARELVFGGQEAVDYEAWRRGRGSASATSEFAALATAAPGPA